MRRMMLTAVAGLTLPGAAFAQDDVAAPDAVAEQEPVAEFGDCALYDATPEMPDAKTATADDRAATIGKIIAYQAALKTYRECLTATSDNEELEVETREAALKEFNRTVAVETDMVKDWQKFDKKFQKENK